MRVLILPDWENWSCDYTSGYIIKHLPHIHFEKRYVRYMNVRKLIHPDDEFDAVWMMLHYNIPRLVSQVREAGKFGKIKILIGVRGAYGIDKAGTFVLDGVDALGVQSWWAYQQLKLVIPSYGPIWITRDGVDEEVFRPIPELRPPDDEFVVGWAGQFRLGKLKRIDAIKKICEHYDLKLAGCHPMEGKFAVPHDKMPEWYNSLSVFFHFSTREGAPRPVIEAASCGIPVITSPTGYGQEVIESKYHAHSEGQARQLLERLSCSPKLRKQIGERNRNEILKKWTWKERVPRYEEFFKQEGNPVG